MAGSRQPAESGARRGAPRLPSGLGVVAALVALVIAARLSYHGFFAGQNLENLLRQNVSLGLVALGVAFVIIGGNFDLSVGGIFGFAGVLFARVAQSQPIGIAAAAAVLGGLAAGIINAVVVNRFRVNSFIATLATGAMLGGLSLEVAKNGTVTVDKDSFTSLGLAKVGGLPVDLIVLAVALIAGGLVLQRTRFGQAIYAVGGNAEASRLVGLPVDRVQAATFAISAVLSAVAGVIAASKVGVGQADAGAALTLQAIAIVVIGGISIMGGEGAVWRVLLGLLILATMKNLFDSLAWSSETQEVATGGAIIAALAADRSHRARAQWRLFVRRLGLCGARAGTT